MLNNVFKNPLNIQCLNIRDETGNLKKDEDNLAKERIDRASRERSDRVGGGCGKGAGAEDFGDFWYQKQLF